MVDKPYKPVYRARRRERFKDSEWQADGYDSRFEWTIGQRLRALGVEFEHQPEALEYVKVCKYTPDFKIKTRSGKEMLIETKGYWLPAERSKHQKVAAQHPDKDIRLVFMNANNRLNKGSNTTYADWCNKHKVKWGHQTIPDSWLNE